MWGYGIRAISPKLNDYDEYESDNFLLIFIFSSFYIFYLTVEKLIRVDSNNIWLFFNFAIWILKANGLSLLKVEFKCSLMTS